MQHLGFIQQMHSALDEAELKPHSWEIRSLQSVSSTNSRVADMLGLYDKVIVLSETQSKGRGRGQNIWYSPSGGLWISLGFLCDTETVELSSPIIQTIHRYLSSYVECEIKEPNDILIAGKKLCGILVETKIKSSKIHQVIVGIGLNVNNEIPNEIKDIATRLADHTDEVPKIHQLASDLITESIKELQQYFPQL